MNSTEKRWFGFILGVLSIYGCPAESAQSESSIRGFVVNDTDCNGVISQPDQAIQGVTVKLYDLNNRELATTVTDPVLFEYAFLNLPQGDYKVVVIVPDPLNYLGILSRSSIPIVPLQGSAGFTVSLSATQIQQGISSTDNNFILQPPSCDHRPFVTETQGGWGAPPHCGNAAAYLASHFAEVFPNGLWVGIGPSIHLSSAIAVKNFLPQGGPTSFLIQDYVNPVSTTAGVFGGQVVALRISVQFSKRGLTRRGLGELYLNQGPLKNRTVNAVLAIAEDVLSGNFASLPSGVSISSLNSVIDSINQNFDDGTQNHGYLRN